MPNINLPSPGEDPNWAPKLNTAIRAINDEVDDNSAEIEDLNGEVSTLDTRIDGLDTRVTNNRNSITSINTTLSGLDSRIDGRIQDVASDIISSDPTIREAAEDAVQDAVDGLDLVVDSDFTANPAGLYSFPNNRALEETTGYSQKYAINPTAIPQTNSFHGLPTTSGDGVISVRSPNDYPTTWGNSIDSSAQQPTSGTGSAYCLVDVGTASGISRVRVRSVSNTGNGIRGIGGVVAMRIVSGSVQFIRWTIGENSKKYALQRFNGSTLTSGTTTTIAQSDVEAKADDLVDLQYFNGSGLVVLSVNGAVAATAILPPAQRTGHDSANLAGMWGRGDNVQSNKLGGWQWLEPNSSVLADRKMVTTDSNYQLPSSVKLNPEQKRQAVGPIFDIKDFGAKVDGVYLTDAQTFAGENQVRSASYTFTSADVGKRMAVMGAGPQIENANDGVWMGTIKSVSESGLTAFLDTTATVSATGLRAIFGTTDDVALARAHRAAVIAGGGTVYFPVGRTIMSQSLYVENNVSFAGYSRDKSWVHIIADKPGTSGNLSGTVDWLTAAGRDASSPLLGCHIHDFGINAEAMIRTDGYVTPAKPLNLYYVKRCSVERMNVWHTPATAIPFDHPIDWCAIRDNYVLNPGRLAPSGVGPGGSGIGVGTGGDGSVQPMIIENNVVVGSATANSLGRGHNGIFLESQTGADPDQGNNGYRIIGNLIVGMPFGISDTGSTGTIIMGNQIIGCRRGIRIAKTSLPGSAPGLHTLVVNNVIQGSTGPDDSTDGMGISIYMPASEQTSVRSYLHAIIEGNQIFECKSWGISLAAPGYYNLDGISIRGNVIRKNGRSGIRLSSAGGAAIRQIAITDNQIVSNGNRRITGDRSGILVESGTLLIGGRIQDNDIYDLFDNPTQVSTISSSGATITGTRIAGNTGDA